MNGNDTVYFASLERKLASYLEGYNCRKLADLSNFPFKTLPEVEEAYKLRKIAFIVPYQAKGIFSFGTKNQRLISLLIGLSLLGNIAGNIAFAIINKEWVFIFGALLSIIGFVSATPYNRFLPLLVALSSISLFAAFFKGNTGEINLAVSFLAGVLYSKILRVIYKSAIVKRALYSETMLCYLLIKRMILLEVFETKTVFQQLPSLS